jgi:serine/threonine protein kinase
MIADKILSSLEFIHYKHLLHRDVQPGNFLMGLGKKLHQIYTIDYAFSTPYQNDLTNKHRSDYQSLNDSSFVGTLKFASLNALQGHRHSRRDDL